MHLLIFHFMSGGRKVSLNPGNNKILVRLENGWHSTAFPVVILAAP